MSNAANLIDAGVTASLTEPREVRVTEIEGDLVSFAVRPKLYPQLRRFCCGESEQRSEREVNKIVREYASGRYKGGTFRVTVDRQRLVGVAAFQAAKASHPDLGPFAGTPQICVLGLSQQYRRHATGGRRLGDLVLEDALRAINTSWCGTPDALVQVNPNNTHARNLFERHGFRLIGAARPDGEADALFRRKGRPVR